MWWYSIPFLVGVCLGLIFVMRRERRQEPDDITEELQETADLILKPEVEPGYRQLGRELTNEEKDGEQGPSEPPPDPFEGLSYRQIIQKLVESFPPESWMRDKHASYDLYKTSHKGVDFSIDKDGDVNVGNKSVGQTRDWAKSIHEKIVAHHQDTHEHLVLKMLRGKL
tara:strand:- start:11496 stop:11999 length:504 start_codon:yes stop_codon:yes gene_type:complete